MAVATVAPSQMEEATVRFVDVTVCASFLLRVADPTPEPLTHHERELEGKWLNRICLHHDVARGYRLGSAEVPAAPAVGTHGWCVGARHE